jgi:hypothetical protein
MRKQFLLIVATLCSTVLAQTKESYETGSGTQSQKGFLDPTHFTVSNSMSFGMSSNSGNSSLKSQSLYSTMMQYRFTSPVTVSLNFGLPIHSTISSAQNLTTDNIQSMEYFKNMPLSASLSWKPTERMLFQVSFERNTYENYFYGSAFPGFYNRSIVQQPAVTKDDKKVGKE